VIEAAALIDQLHGAGFGLFSGVPCSYLTPLINTVIGSPTTRYVGAANEGEAVAICCGAELGGTPAVAMFQNSGLGNAVSPLTSLTATFGIPLLIVVTWRGRPGGPADEPQHAVMGQITPALLDTMGVAWEIFPDSPDCLRPMIDRACDHMASQRAPYALIMPKGCVSGNGCEKGTGVFFGRPAREEGRRATENDSRPLFYGAHDSGLDQDDVLRVVQQASAPTDAVLATTGFTGRALYALDDRPNQFYMVGSMGCLSSFGLGLALVQPHRRIVVLDGDGAALMRMGALAAVGCQQPGNLVHVLLDNGVHDSTGGQATLARSVDFAGIARSCGYPRTVRCTGLEHLADTLAADVHELTFIHVRTRPRASRKLPRPTISPPEVADRMRQWLKSNDAYSLGERRALAR
jgi:phosphonopyruvate decarboxylase